ncbi:MARVEL domain-containing protein 3 [Syngnathoides biaculeatus]|uniref:MARVEL domain-containing protein 3 n=1 Tax=Syngnathoides biaculeatus TaxID=300417 RepID=UPI002ADDAB98|nr:MARVEL domain-containing protein 3 [Syngnathoides biaculeatus]XP_061669991.1 MARVEL domain-containing protein 3 [Syngnathoides biaculeatus]XP_061669992.1 MARVEL domain-containing protein 3 [Syngnathoides biaculeatus]
MPERSGHRPGSDAHVDYKRSPRFDKYHGGDREEKPGVADGRASAGDRRPRQRDMTSTSQAAFREHHHQRPSKPYGSSSAYSSEGEYHERQPREALYNLRYVLTSRGLCQLMEAFVNLLIVICAGVPHSNNGGYRDLASLGGIYHYHFGGAGAFHGTDAERVQELDRLFNELKRPPYAFAMACGGIVMIYALVMLALGVFRVPYRYPPVLLGEALVDLLVGLGYIAGLAFFFIRVQETYDDPVCRERERMYKSKGHKGFECQFHGADIAGGLFGALGLVAFISGAALAVRAFRAVREMKKQKGNNQDNPF